MAVDVWKGGKAAWSVPNDWTQGTPTSASDVVVYAGEVHAMGLLGAVAAISVDGPNSTLDFETPANDAMMGAGATSLAVSGNLSNSGRLLVDAENGDGGSSVMVAGELINSGLLQIGDEGLTLGMTDMLSVGSLDNFGGAIDLYGCAYMSTPSSAMLDVGGSAGFGAAGALEGHVDLQSDAIIEFARGEITEIAAKAELTLGNYNVFLADASATHSNSALTGLKTIDGQLNLDDGAWVLPTGALANSGDIDVDAIAQAGGSKLGVGGALANSGTISIGSTSLVTPAGETGPASVVSAASLSNQIGGKLGAIDLTGNTNAVAALELSGAAGFGSTGTSYGAVNLSGEALIEFAGGQIGSIAAGSELSLNGAGAFVADETNTAANSALTGLSSIAGALNLEGGASLQIAGALTNKGLVALDRSAGAGGSNLSVAGQLTNSGTLAIGPASGGRSVATEVDAASLVNSGTIDLFGALGYSATLNVSGGMVNTGAVHLNDDSERVQGAVTGADGVFTLTDGSSLEFGASVASGQTVSETSAGNTLILDDAAGFDAPIRGVVAGDAFDIASFAFASTHVAFQLTSAGHGALTLTDGSAHCTLHFAGDVNFHVSAYDGGAGIQIKFV